MNQAVKDAFEQLIEACEERIDYKPSVVDYAGTEQDALKEEAKDFVVYLASSDGEVRKAETEFLKEYFDVIGSPQQIVDYTKKYGIYSTAFESRPPMLFKTLVMMDNDQYDNEEELDTSLSLSYIEYFKMLGQEFIVCDGTKDEQEVEDMDIYIGMLKEYFAENYAGPDKAVSIYTRLRNEDGEGAEATAGSTAGVASGNATETEGNQEDNKTLDELLDELNGLIGLDAVKKDVTSLIHLQAIQKIRLERGLGEIPVSKHLVFYGNPGTGKTTVARLLAKIYHKMGILSKGQFVETERSGLVAGYVGQSALKTQAVIDSAKGGILFIDEAYSLVYKNTDNDYGAEVIETLLKAMEDYRDDFIVIVAGYPDLMQQFIESNPGLRSRFNKYINFPDYTPEQMEQIFNKLCQEHGYHVTDEAMNLINSVIRRKYNTRGKNFANGREVRNMFETIISKQADRVFFVENPTNEQLCTIEKEDAEWI